MAEELSLSLDIDDEDIDFELLEEELSEIPEIEEIQTTPDMGVGICLLLVLIAPLITEIIIRRNPEAIKKFKNIVSKVLTKSKNLFKTVKLTIKHKMYTRQIQNKEEIEEVIEELMDFVQK